MPIHCESDDVGELLLLDKDSIISIKKGSQGDRIIKSTAIKGDLCITVPSYTKENAYDMYMLPIVQMKAAEEFENWIKENY